MDRAESNAPASAAGDTVRGRPWGTVIALVVLVLLAGGGWYAWKHYGSGPPPAAQAPPPPEVTVATPLTQKLTEWDEFTGRFEAIDYVEVRGRVSGYLDKVGFVDGQLVEKGQLLFTIDQRPFINALNEANAVVQSASAAVEQARLTEGRTERLRDTNSPAFQRSSFEDQVQNRLQSQGSLDQAKAAQATAQLNLDFTEVKAPVTGRISYRRADPGNLVSDTTLLTTIVSLDPIYFTFDLSEADFLGYQRAVARGALPGTRDNKTVVGVKLQDEEAWREGQMNFVDNQVDTGSGTVRARAVLANTDLLVAPGQFGTIRIPGSPEYDAMLVPEEAIVTDQSQKIVMIVNAEGKVEPRAIRPGPTEGKLRIVRSGLKPDDKVIINGIARVRPGMTVTPKDGRIEAPAHLARAE